MLDEAEVCARGGDAHAESATAIAIEIDAWRHAAAAPFFIVDDAYGVLLQFREGRFGH